MEAHELLKQELEKLSVAELNKILGPLERSVQMDPEDAVLISLYVTVLGTRNAKRDSAPLASAVDGGDEPFSIFKGEQS